MVRSCVRLLLVALLVLGPPVHGWLENSADADDGSSHVTTLGIDGNVQDNRQSGTNRTHAAHRCHHIVCSSSYLIQDPYALSRPAERAGDVLRLDARDLRAATFEHDPPIPKRINGSA